MDIGNHMCDITDHIELIIPCMNEQENIYPLYEAINDVFKKMESVRYSLLFINDGSDDHTLDYIKRLVSEKGNDVIRYISFARQFGKESAIYAGLEKCTGDYIVLMDADLQHPPELIPQMYAELKKGHDCCGARRINRTGEPIIRSIFARAFYHLINHFTAMQLIPGGSDYRMMTHQMAKAVTQLTERERFIKGILSWVGFDTVWIPYQNTRRRAGKTKWSFLGLTGYAWNGFIAFATTPLRVVVYFGILVTLLSVAFAFYVLVTSLKGGGERTGYSTIVLLILFFGGVITTVLGVIGEYMARIYMELKQRPIYIEKETNLIPEKTTHNNHAS